MYSFRSMSFALLNAFFALSAASPLAGLENRGSCRSTKVAVLGAGVAGITAAQSLSKADVKDFVIVEYNGEIGGRVAHTTFGKQKNGEPYTVELGANWVQGTVSPGGPENPIWTLAKKYNLQNTFSDYSSIETFDNTGANDFLDLLAEYSTDFGNTQVDADNILTQNLQDRSMRSGLSLNGWKPKKNMKAQAAEWWQFDWEYAYSPDESSELYAVANYNTTFNLYSQANNYVYDSRGFSAFIQGEASTYLKPKDSRLLLNTIVTNITYSDKGVTVHNKDGSCISAEYAICTFSLGVLQNDVVSFSPQLPYWKQQGIETFSMGTYTKIFMQFPADQVFWNTSIQFFLYADPIERGYYPVFQSLDGPGFLPGSGILFVTVVNAQSYVVEQQDDATTKKQVLAVLRKMYGHKNVPEPTAFMFPRWSLEPWAYGSYSNWPPGTSLEMHQNLRANVDRLWFAGEHTCI
jgi:polyamine oxidase